MEEKLGQDPAFPLTGYLINDEDNRNPFGTSKRLYIATAAISGLLANPTFIYDIKSLSEEAFKIADEILKRE